MNQLDQDFDQLCFDIQTACGSQTGTGFHEVHCPICGNTGKKKAGFKFEGDKIVYNCFRGSCTLRATVYEKGEFVPRKFKELMRAFNIDISARLLTAGRKRNKLFDNKLDEHLYQKNVYKDMTFPSSLIPLEESSSADFFMQKVEDRKVLPYELYYQTKGDFRGCMAIPLWFYDKLIGIEYYTRKGMYYTYTTNENLIFTRTKYLPKKILLVEGMFDVMCFPNTVGTKNASLSPKQAYHIRDKDVVVLPDRLNSKLYEVAEKYKWKICIPPWEEKDLNEAVINKGLIVAAKMVSDYTMPVSRKTRVLYEQWRIKESRMNDVRRDYR